LDKTKMQAMKVSPKQIQSEVDLMRECADQKEFVQLYDFVETPRRYYLILEYCDGGTLERTAKEGSKLGDNQVARLMRQMLQGLAFLHARNIMHRDVKPQNALLVGQVSSEHVNVKLGDFGIAARLPPGRLLREKTGTAAFMAPEMHLLPSKSLGYNHKVDMWAIGTVMVFLIAHEYAFVHEGNLMRDELIRGDLPIWEADVFSSLFERVQSAAGLGSRRPSPIARDLVQKLLAPNPSRRLSATAALEHDWFRHPVLAADMRVVDDMPLLLWEDFRGVIGTDKIARKIPEMAAWVADTCGLDELVDMISTPLHAATPRARSAGRGRKGSCHPKSSGKGDKPSCGSSHRRRSSRAPHERAKLLG